MNNDYAEVIVEVPNRQLDRPFHYLVPSHLRPLPVGSRVLVSFGARTVPGYVLGYSTPPSGITIKSIKKVLGDSLNQELIELARWMSHKYLCTLSESLQCVLGPGREPRKVAKGLYAKVNSVKFAKTPLTAKQQIVLETAIANAGLSKAKLARVAGVSTATVDALIKKKLLFWSTPGEMANDLKHGEKPFLTEEQLNVCQTVNSALDSGVHRVFLLHGVTGSGKTEVYLNVIEKVMAKGKQAIVLVPEISLTPQMITIFKGRFGSNVAVLHSRLSAGERYAERQRIKKGEAQVVLGARSAVFAPVPNLGLIIIDEEHEPLYKQEENPKYHARDVAIYRTYQHKGLVLLGSATPALESYCRAEPSGPYQLLTMGRRVEARPLPTVRVVDMRQEMGSGNSSIFSRVLLQNISQRLRDKQQIMLFINRRGYATFIVCRRCGQVIKCPYCDISLTYHNDGILRCHYCNYQQRTPKRCVACHSDAIGFFGTGTQKVEEEVRRFFPNAHVLRMDGDTTGRKGSHQSILNTFKHGGDVLVGTQMIAKGLDMPKVTLVGVINADTMLYMPDFRAAERTFQLLTQVSGRAGRGVTSGETIIQTYNPEHYSIITAKRHDYASFYQHEMNLRRALKYPPFYYLTRVLVKGGNEQEVEAAAHEIKITLEQISAGSTNKNEDIIILGPAPAALAKVQKQYRWQIMIKGRILAVVREVTKSSIELWERTSRLTKKPSVSIDIEPQFLM